MYLFNITANFSLSSSALLAASSQVLPQLDLADLILRTDPFQSQPFRDAVTPLTQVDLIQAQALEADQLAVRHDAVPEPEQAPIRTQIGTLLSEMRSLISVSAEGEVVAPDRLADVIKPLTGAAAQSGAARLFRNSEQGNPTPPASERLPQIRDHLRRHLDSVDDILGRLERITVWAKPTLDTLPEETRALVTGIKEQIAIRGRLGREMTTLSVETAAPISEQVSHLYLRMQALEDEVSRHEILGSVFRSDIVNSDWALSAPSLDEAQETELSELAEYFDTQRIQPGYRGRIETLLLQYFAYLTDKKGGELGPLPDQPFDMEVFATAIVEPPDPEVITLTLNFFRSSWGRNTPNLEEVLHARGRILREHAQIREERQPLFPERYEIVQAEAGDGLRDYLKRFGFYGERNDTIRDLIGVQPTTIMKWGSQQKGRTTSPGEIGHVMVLYHYLVEENWRQETLYGKNAERVLLPDPMELLRLAYGQWAKAFFANVAEDDPWTLVVPIPRPVFDLSYAEMFYGRVLQRLFDAYRYHPSQVASGLGKVYDEAITSGTLRRHLRGKVMPHRRFGKTRETLRLIFGDEMDFFLEAKSVIDQVMRVALPGGRQLDPTTGARSNWNLRLVPQKHDVLDLSDEYPELDVAQHPFKYLQGGRDDFTLLLAELRDRLHFMTHVQGLNRSQSVTLANGETRTVDELLSSVEDFERRHQILLARLGHYRSHPEKAPFSAPRAYAQFYRHVLLFARTLRQDLPVEGSLEVGRQTLDYRLVEPNAAGVTQATLQLTQNDDGSWQATTNPTHFMSLVEGNSLSPALASDLFRLCLSAAVLDRRGMITATSLRQLTQQMFPQRQEAERSQLIELAQSLEGLEARGLPLSRLHGHNDDVVAIYERADRILARKEEEDPHLWLTRRLEEFLWNRFGLPFKSTDHYLQILRAYFDGHPDYANSFDPATFEEACAAYIDGNGRIRGLLLEFLLVVGLPASEEATRAHALQASALPHDLRLTAAAAPEKMPELPEYPSRQAIFVEDFLRSQSVDASRWADLTIFFGQLTERFGRPLREGIPIAPDELRSSIEAIGAELNPLFGVQLLEIDALVALSNSWLDRVIELQVLFTNMSHAAKKALSQRVLREFLMQVAFNPSMRPLGPMILETLGRHLRDVHPKSGAFKHSVDDVTAWYEDQSRQTIVTHSDLMGLLDLLEEMGEATNRDEFLEQLIELGEGVLPRSLSSIEDWNALLDRHHIMMSLFHPEERRAARVRFDALYEALPAAPVVEEEPAAVARPAAPVRLERPSWDPKGLTFLSPAEHRAFWQGVADKFQGDETRFIVFYLTEEGIQAARLNEADHERLSAVNQPGNSTGGSLSFVDQDTGNGVEILNIQVRWTARTSPNIVSLVNWLAEVGPDHPSYIDAQATQAVAFYLPISTQTKAEFHNFFQAALENPSPQKLRKMINLFMQGRQGQMKRDRIYYDNAGPWHLTSPLRQGLSHHLIDNPGLANRFEKVFDILDHIPNLPEEVARPLADAIRTLASIADPQTADYEQVVASFVTFWDQALEFDAQRMRTLLPAHPKFLALADAAEINRTNSVGLVIARQQIRDFLDQLEQSPKKGSFDVIRQYYRTLEKIFNTPALEPLQRALRITLYINISGTALVKALMALVSKRSGGLFGRNSKRGMEGFLNFYLEHRSELLWRLQENSESVPWVNHVLPDRLGPRHKLSTEFPELEALSFSEIDTYRHYVSGVIRTPRAFITRTDNNGLWEHRLISPELVILEPVAGLGLLPVGFHNGETGPAQKAIYCRRLLEDMQRRLRREGKVATANDLETKLTLFPDGEEEIMLPDVFGAADFRLVSDEIEYILPSEQHLTSSIRMMKTSLSAVFAEPSLIDLHPILAFIHATVHSDAVDDSDLKAGLFELSEFIAGRIKGLEPRAKGSSRSRRSQRTRGPQAVHEEIRGEVLRIYRKIRSALLAANVGTRFDAYRE